MGPVFLWPNIGESPSSMKPVHRHRPSVHGPSAWRPVTVKALFEYPRATPSDVKAGLTQNDLEYPQTWFQEKHKQKKPGRQYLDESSS